MLRIFTISRPVFFVRDGKTIQINNNGDYITQEEFATLQSEMEVICVNETTGERFVYTPGEPIVYVTAVEETVAETENTPATDAGRVPADLPVGSKSAKA